MRVGGNPGYDQGRLPIGRRLPACPTLLVLFCTGTIGADTLSVLPKSVTLSTPQSRQQLIVEMTSGQFQQDLTAKAQWTSSNANIAAVSATGLITPVSDGEEIRRAHRRTPGTLSSR